MIYIYIYYKLRPSCPPTHRHTLKAGACTRPGAHRAMYRVPRGWNDAHPMATMTNEWQPFHPYHIYIYIYINI